MDRRLLRHCPELSALGRNVVLLSLSLKLILIDIATGAP